MYLGLDLSTTQLKCVAIRSDLKLVHEASVELDADLGPKYGIEKGVLTNPENGEIFAPTAMWLEAIDIVLQRLKESGLDFSQVKGISGAGMQHGTVFWSKHAERLLNELEPEKSLIDQLGPSEDGKDNVFSHPYSPNWQDSSTQKQCDVFEAFLPGKEHELADLTGSRAYHVSNVASVDYVHNRVSYPYQRFSGPQIMRFRENHPQEYRQTSRISLVSSFLATVFLGKFSPIDISDVCGMNLWDVKNGRWHDGLLELAAGEDGAEDLKNKLGSVPEDGGTNLGNISSYFVHRYGFNPRCVIAPSTGDNPATIIAQPLRESDAIVSLGTSTTFLMSTPAYKPDQSYHFFNSPTTAGLYMFMLCYKNGSFARERVRDTLNPSSTASSTSTWENFDKALRSTPPLNQSDPSEPMHIGLFFPRPEAVPSVPSLTRYYTYVPSTAVLTQSSTPPDATAIARITVESQFLSCRLRSMPLVTKPPGTDLPPQPRRIYLVGGGSANKAIAKLAGEVLGGAEGVYRLEIGGNACALGAAYKAVWAVERDDGETFEALIGKRWNEEEFIVKVDEGYRAGVYEKYGEALEGFRKMEEEVVAEVAEK